MPEIRVLLVDDHAMMRAGFRTILSLEDDIEVVGEAATGAEAISAAAALHPDVVCMDVQMPDMDGLEATRRIRADARWQKLPVIAITAKAMRDDQEQCRKAGCNDYLAKPIELDRLISLLRVWLPSTA